MKRLCTILALAAFGYVVLLLVGRQRSLHKQVSPRDRQRTPEGKTIVDEWGEESFPASDAPQSW